MLRRTAITFIGAILAAAALPAAAQDGKTLNFGIISTESSSNQKQVWQPVIDDLSRAIGVPVKPSSPPTTPASSKACASTRCRWPGMATSRPSRRWTAPTARCSPRSSTRTATRYWSLLIVNKDSDLKTLDDVLKRGASLSYGAGDPNFHVRHRSAGLLPVGRQQDRAQDLLQDRARQQPRSQPAVGDQQAGGRGRQQHRVAGTLSHQHRQGRQRARARVVEVAADSGGSAGHAQAICRPI